MTRFLVIDDDPLFGNDLARRGMAGGLEVHCFESLLDALYGGPLEDYDAAIVDCVMPTVSGFEVAKYLETFRKMPVVLVSATDSFEEHARRDCNRALAFVPKSSGGAAILEVAMAVTHTNSRPKDPILDASVLADLRQLSTGEDADFLLEQAQMFAKRGRILLEKLTLALERHDWTVAADQVHALAGTAGVLGALRVRDCATRLEEMLRTERLAGVSLSVSTLLLEFGEAREALLMEATGVILSAMDRTSNARRA